MTAAQTGKPAGCAPSDGPPAEEASPPPASVVAGLLRSIAGEFEVAMGRAERVAAGCDLLRGHLSNPPTAEDLESLQHLPPLLRLRDGPMAAAVFDLLEPVAASCATPWLLLEGMLASRDEGLARRGLGLAARLAERGALVVDRRIALSIAALVEAEGSPLAGPAALRDAARLLARCAAGAAEHLFLNESDGRLRRLGARLLDLDARPVRPDLAERLLGAGGLAFLRPYLDYTRATHLDLVDLSPAPDVPPPALPSLRRAEAACGPDLLKEVIARVGWARLNLGLDVREQVGVSVGGSLPLLAAPAEAALLQSCDGARVALTRWVFVAHGGPSGPDRRPDASAGDLIARFRSYNLEHAGMLAEILDVAPLTRDKVRRMLQHMDRIVSDFTALFSRHTQECAILPDVYGDLRPRIVSELEHEPDAPQLSAELTRLVQAFEDPGSLGEVRTLHGLKRYLHQRGLRLGFRLVEVTRATNRTVDLVVASSERVLRAERIIQYIDFETDQPDRIPYPVDLVVEGFSRQVLHGCEKIPGVRIFLYGNEVHYFLAFGNHPAFLRIDYAPPLQGGMIDLEYYGVSKYELSLHPNPDLDAIRVFFRRLDFDAEVESTRIHARYDKERAQDIGDLCRKAGVLFHLVPYLMEVDWVIGYLALDAEAKRKVAEAWADSFAHWGALPLRRLLTEDRQAILERIATDAAGPREIRWSGRGPYRDRYADALPAGFFIQAATAIERLGVAPGAHPAGELPRAWGQLDLDRTILAPLREAVSRGEILATPEGFVRAGEDLFQPEHEAEAFARILGAGTEALEASARLASLVSPLERSLRFRTTGSVDGREVQRALLMLRGREVGLFVLRDEEGIARLACFSHGAVLYRSRDTTSSDWRSNGSSDAMELASLLRRSSILVPDASRAPEELRREASEIRELLRWPGPPPRPALLAGERIVTGLRASPGRAVGTALFGTAGRAPEDFDGAVLFAPAVRPEDSAFLYHAAGIVSTGGGILSHAGLIAAQFRKPALIIAGQWRQDAGRPVALAYRTLEYEEETRRIGACRVSVRRDVREPEHLLREGDLVALDAGGGTLRVLGQDHDALALHEGLRSFGQTGRQLASAADDRDVLALRGRRLRARHQIERVLVRLADGALARHAVEEILLGGMTGTDAASRAEKAGLLRLALANPRVSDACREWLARIGAQAASKSRAALAKALNRVPTSTSLHEVLALRLDALRLRDTMEEVRAASAAVQPDAAGPAAPDATGLDEVVQARLTRMRAQAALALRPSAGAPAAGFGLRHRLRQIERLDDVLGTSGRDRRSSQRERDRLHAADEAALGRLARRCVLTRADGGFELFPLMGWKAANLSEIERLGGVGLVPPWFVVADAAFRRLLDAPAAREAGGAMALRGAIETILARGDLGNDRKSALIRGLWEAIDLPEDIVAQVLEAYRALAAQDTAGTRAGTDPAEPLVAIRSSAWEEDAESAARAGEFETFLFVRGVPALMAHLRRAWSGLWTERAIHHRAVLHHGTERVGGGIIVQRMVWSRVAGVLQTVNIAEGELREMVVNAGLGLGEGIVSGAVAADHVVVAKGAEIERGPLRFRYVTGDKREQVVFDERAGFGTRRTETLYHQRLRPALEYVELYDLARVASRLEAAYGYPLDIEFGIEGSRLWILQARPVAASLTSLRETIERHPLVPQERRPATRRPRRQRHDPS